MKILQTSLALIALFALMAPCVCIADHHHAEVDHADQFSVEHTCCKACHEEPCSPSPQAPLMDASPSVDIPVRQMELITILKTDRPILVAASRPSGDLQRLQTVQLLI